MFMALAMAEMASSAPTSGIWLLHLIPEDIYFSGGIYYWTHRLSPPKYRNIMCWIVGYTNTITYITAVAGADWSCAVALMAGVNIGSDGAFVATHHQTL
jgi:amino acid transporter